MFLASAGLHVKTREPKALGPGGGGLALCPWRSTAVRKESVVYRHVSIRLDNEKSKNFEIFIFVSWAGC